MMLDGMSDCYDCYCQHLTFHLFPSLTLVEFTCWVPRLGDFVKKPVELTLFGVADIFWGPWDLLGVALCDIQLCQDGFRPFKDLVGRQKPQGTGSAGGFDEVVPQFFFKKVYRYYYRQCYRTTVYPTYCTVIIYCHISSTMEFQSGPASSFQWYSDSITVWLWTHLPKSCAHNGWVYSRLRPAASRGSRRDEIKQNHPC